VLHDNGELDHFGRSGLNMFSYNPAKEGQLYMFDADGRQSARTQLLADIPRLVSAAGDAIQVGKFYEAAYSATPAHKNDIDSAMFESEELEVVTRNGGIRRKGCTIRIEDTLRLKDQRSFFTMFGQKRAP
jgi:hypothetical protein